MLSLRAFAGTPTVTFVTQTTCNALTNAATCSSISFSSGDLLVFVSKTQNTVGVAAPVFSTSGTALTFVQAIAPTNGFTGGGLTAAKNNVNSASNGFSTRTAILSRGTTGDYNSLSRVG